MADHDLSRYRIMASYVLLYSRALQCASSLSYTGSQRVYSLYRDQLASAVGYWDRPNLYHHTHPSTLLHHHDKPGPHLSKGSGPLNLTWRHGHTFLIVCFTRYFVFSIAVLPQSPGILPLIVETSD